MAHAFRSLTGLAHHGKSSKTFISTSSVVCHCPLPGIGILAYLLRSYGHVLFCCWLGWLVRLPRDGTNVRTVRIDNRRGGRAEELKTLYRRT